MKKIKHLTEYCLGCGLCSVYCSAAHAGLPKLDLVKAFKRRTPPPPNVIVERGADSAFAASCHHCTTPYCVMSCITGAMSKDPATGLVSCDTDRCVGCWTCVAACPYGMVAVVENQSAKPKANKCDHCNGVSEVPMCVQHCPNEARIWIEEEAGQ
ncbi:MAG: 4Fe-4S binding protein [Firmicutes bacterium]|nr:4Fe-4S binding protein [Bacillota bacterium]